MLADNLILAPDEEGHQSFPGLPAQSLKLTPHSTGMRIDAIDAEVYTESSNGTNRVEDSPLTWPSRLLIRTTLSESEIIRRCILGQSTPDEMALTFQEV